MVWPLWKTAWRFLWRFLRILKIELPYDLAIPLLSIYPDKLYFRKIHAPSMFIAVVFTIAMTGNQPKCPSTDKRINKIWYIYTAEY